jgi:hypothetical protein
MLGVHLDGGFCLSQPAYKVMKERLRAGHTFRPAHRRPVDEVVARDRWDGAAL